MQKLYHKLQNSNVNPALNNLAQKIYFYAWRNLYIDSDWIVTSIAEISVVFKYQISMVTFTFNNKF